MNVDRYFNILKEKGYEEAQNYKDSIIPSTLYKYTPLLNRRFINYEEENDRKLHSLLENKIWLCNYKELNDPFEYKMFYVNKNKLKEYGWPADGAEKLESLVNQIKDQILTTSLSSIEANEDYVCLNMPMWAHYANNHEGYCIEYKVENPRLIFPVSYEDNRCESSVIVTRMLDEAERCDKNPIYTDLFRISLNCKHKFWQYEKEFRILMRNNNNNNNNKSLKGELFSLDELGLKIKTIYIGLKCDKVYEEKLKYIAKKLGCELYKMTFDEYGEKFQLGKERILL